MPFWQSALGKKIVERDSFNCSPEVNEEWQRCLPTAHGVDAVCPHSAAEEESLEFGAFYTVSGIVHRGQVIRSERGSLAREISF